VKVDEGTRQELRFPFFTPDFLPHSFHTFWGESRRKCLPFSSHPTTIIFLLLFRFPRKLNSLVWQTGNPNGEGREMRESVADTSRFIFTSLIFFQRKFFSSPPSPELILSFSPRTRTFSPFVCLSAEENVTNGIGNRCVQVVEPIFMES